jgi:hypothetical protein
MITIKNRRRYVGMSFEDYLALPGYSFSFLNRERFGATPEITETAAMRRGTMVDAILTQPDQADPSNEGYAEARSIAHEIKRNYSYLLSSMVPQVSYTADFTITTDHGTYTLPVRGRLDFEIPGKLVLDLKVTGQKNVDATIRHMGYADQLTGYCLMSGSSVAYIAAYCVPLRQVELRSIALDYKFWERKILKFGV